jgi:hypothetical protein
MTTSSKLVATALLVGVLGIPDVGLTQEIPGWLQNLKLPNSGAKSLMTPSAWGAAYGVVFGRG